MLLKKRGTPRSRQHLLRFGHRRYQERDVQNPRHDLIVTLPATAWLIESSHDAATTGERAAMATGVYGIADRLGLTPA